MSGMESQCLAPPPYDTGDGFAVKLGPTSYDVPPPYVIDTSMSAPRNSIENDLPPHYDTGRTSTDRGDVCGIEITNNQIDNGRQVRILILYYAQKAVSSFSEFSCFKFR